MLFYGITGLINAIASTILGLFVFFKNRKNRVGQTFILFSLSVAFWSYAYYFWQMAKNANEALFWTRMLMAGAIFIPIFYVHFVWAFLEKLNKGKKQVLILGYFITLFFLVLDFTRFFINKVEPELYFKFWPKPGIAYHPFLIMWFLSIAYCTKLLFSKYKSSVGIKRAQIRYVLLGITIGFIGGGTNYFLWYGIPIPPIGNILVVVYVGATGYAILRYRLMDIRLVIRKSAVYVALAFCAYAFFYFGVWFLNKMFGSVYNPGAYVLAGFLTAVALLFFFLFEKFVNFIANNYFFGALYNQHETLKKMGEKLTTIVDLGKLITSVSEVIKKTLGLEKIAFLLIDENSGKYTVQKMAGFSKSEIISLTKDDELELFLKRNRKPMTYEELEMKSFYNLKERMGRIGASLLLPLVSQGRLQGIIILGKKISEDAFSQEDINLLESLSHQTALAIENARLYDRMENFNKILKEKVDEQTRDIKEKNVRLRKLLAMKTEFLHIASHQLRTPVSAIRGLVSMLEEGDFDDADLATRKRVFSGILKKTEKMTNVLDDILIATELDTVKNFKLKKNELMKVDIDDMSKKVINELKYEAEEKGIEISYKKEYLPFPSPDTYKEERNEEGNFNILSNERDLRHILVNLVNNAITYTRAGGKIEINVNRDKNLITWKVKDTGIGIPKNNHFVFEKFKRGKNALELNRDGSGLGLFIVKKLVDAHPGGEVGFRSNKGQGTTFWVKFPAAF